MMVEWDRISRALLALRLGVFVVMLMWTLDKFVNTAHATRIRRAAVLVARGEATLRRVGGSQTGWPALVARRLQQIGQWR